MVQSTLKATINFEDKPAALFVQLANKFKSSIRINFDNKSVNGKSIMGMLVAMDVLLKSNDSQNVTIMADGDDESEALDELNKFFIVENQ